MVNIKYYFRKMIIFSYSSTCQNGCVTCTSVTCVEQCTFSDWSPFGECSAPCNGTQSRYQTLQGPNCNRNNTNMESQPCSTATTTYPKGCSTCTCLNTTQELCVTNCAVTNDTCSQIEDPLFTYTYATSTDGSCCGSCVKVPSEYLEISCTLLICIFLNRTGNLFSYSITS
jgi:hypothetical protein